MTRRKNLARGNAFVGAASTCAAILALVAAVSALSLQSPQAGSRAPTAAKSKTKSEAAVSPAIPVKFVDVLAQSGITFVQDTTQTEEKYYLETMGTGVGWIDYDQDGLLDLYFVQSAATDIYKPAKPLRSALYHNNGDGTFTDVTEKAGVGAEGHYG